ncbi:hypothetical protein Tco_0511018 [Tanacetum coccineum]
MVFHLMDTEEVSDRFVAPCFVKGMEVYDGEINLGEEDNMISKEYAVKLCLEHEVKRGNKVAKKELIVALKGKIYFVKFIINLDEDDVEPGVIFGRSFLRMTKEITDFGTGTITIYPDFDPFLEETEDEGKDMYDWDQLLDFNLDDIELLGEEELPPFVCKMGKSSRNKKKSMENLSLFYLDIGTSSSAGGHLTQEEAAKEALAIRMSQKFSLLEEVCGIETLACMWVRRMYGRSRLLWRCRLDPLRANWKLGREGCLYGGFFGEDLCTSEFNPYSFDFALMESTLYIDYYHFILSVSFFTKTFISVSISLTLHTMWKKSVKEEEEAVKRVKGEALKEEDDLGAFIFPIRLEGHVNENALADRREDFNEACKLDEEIQHHLQMKWHGRTEVKIKEAFLAASLREANEVGDEFDERKKNAVEEVELIGLAKLP